MISNIIDYDDVRLTKIHYDDLLKMQFNIKDIKLLEPPIEIINNTNSYTLLKISCNKKLKIFLKTIERIINNDDNDILVSINYNINKNKDYYDLLLNKKIIQLLDDDFNISEYYNICLSLVDTVLLWKIHSIEISYNKPTMLINNYIEIQNDINVENFDPDYKEIIESLNSESKLILDNITSKINNLNLKKTEIEKLFTNKLNINNLELYREQLNLYSDLLNF